MSPYSCWAGWLALQWLRELRLRLLVEGLLAVHFNNLVLVLPYSLYLLYLLELVRRFQHVRQRRLWKVLVLPSKVVKRVRLLRWMR